MNAILQLAIPYIKGFIHNDSGALPEELTQDQWQGLYSFLLKQDLAALIYPFVAGLPARYQPGRELMQVWERGVVASVSTHCQSLHLIKELLRAFQEKNLPVMMLKGVTVAKFYRNPEYRLMRDVDFLAGPDCFTQAEQVLMAQGYSLFINDDKHAIYEKPGGLYIEMHRFMEHPGYMKKLNTETWEANLWKRSCPDWFEGCSYHGFSDEDALIHQILHLAVHVAHSDVTLKHLIDGAVLVKARGKDLDWVYIREMLQEMGLLCFAGILFTCYETLFAIGVPEALTRQGNLQGDAFAALIVDGFTAEKAQGAHRLFKYLLYEYPAIAKYPVFNPVVWGGELLLGITYHRMNLWQSLEHATAVLPHYGVARRMMKQMELQ